MPENAHRIIVVQFVTLDGVADDPDGSFGTPYGGWAFRFGPQVFAGDKFELGPLLQSGVLLMGRATWQLFSTRWPSRTDAFATAMNSIGKRVVSETITDAGAWSNSEIVAGDPVETARRLREQQDVIVIGSLSVVRALQQTDVIDEYRLLLFPVVLGAGTRLFDGPAGDRGLEMVSTQRSGAAALLRYQCGTAPTPA
jgi:dihydrofolate reductase